MSLREVTSLIGQPTLTLPDFNTNEMLDAYFYKSKINFNEHHNKEEGVTLTYCSHSLSLVFDNNVLIKIEEAYRYKCG